MSLQLIMGRLHRADQATTEDQDKVQTLREWLQASFDTERDRMTGAEAAILILLPIAVAAIGMMAFGIILFATADQPQPVVILFRRAWVLTECLLSATFGQGASQQNNPVTRSLR